MGFKAYRIEAKQDGLFAFGEGLFLKFSGPDGLIALWTKSHRDQAESPWQVQPADLLLVTGLKLDPETHWIVFEQKDDAGAWKFARLLSVSGLCARGKTDILIALEPLLNGPKDGDRPTVKKETRPRIWSEELVLEGTPGSSTDTWTWGTPSLAIGSATVGGHKPLR